MLVTHHLLIGGEFYFKVTHLIKTRVNLYTIMFRTPCRNYPCDQH